MGHKGVSKRKPKKSQSFSKDNINQWLFEYTLGESPSVPSLVKDNGAILNRVCASGADWDLYWSP
jgi:hypothetical protein